MKKEDWLDYFEAVNGRTPSQEEVSQALANGEFLEEAPQAPVQEPVQPVVTEASVQTPPVQEPVYQQPVYQQPVQPQQPAQPQQQFQGQPVNQTYQQGQPVQPTPSMAFSQSKQGQQDVYNVQVAVPIAYSSFFKQFWTWLVSAWKKPSTFVATHKYNGYLSVFLLSFFASLFSFTLASKTVSGISSLMNNLNSLSGGYNSGYSAPGLDISLFFKLLFGFGFVFFSIVFAGYVVRRFIYKEATTLPASFEKYGRLFSINVLLQAVSTLLIYLGVYSIAFFILAINLTVLSGASAFAIADFEKTTNMDKFHQYLLGLFVNGIIITIFFMVGSAIAGESLMSGMFGF